MLRSHNIILIVGVVYVAFATVDARQQNGRVIAQTLRPRGGSSSSSSPYELNPNYKNNFRPVTVGDLENPRRIPPPQQTWSTESRPKQASSFAGQQYHSPSFWDNLQSYSARLHQFSPTLSIGTLSCIVIFLLWHAPPFQSFLQQYFVCSRINVVKRGRYPALLLSALSHASPAHLLVNMYAFLTFGPSVRQILGGWPLWPLVIGAAMTGSCCYLLLSGRSGGGCMGLSGVTLALLAIVARAYPQRELGFVVGVVPMRLPAQMALACLFVWSLLGTIAGKKGGGVAHAAHLGGLLFGSAYYEVWLQRRDIRLFLRKARRLFLSKTT